MIKYIGPAWDNSGYGEASRNHILALTEAGVDLSLQQIHYSSSYFDIGPIASTLTGLLNKKGDYRIKLLHVTPDQNHRFLEDGKYHVSFCYWETDKIPDEFAHGLSFVDEIWTGSQANKKAIEKAGIDKKIFVFPQAIDTKRRNAKPYRILDFNGTLFYSIFEWTERKNPRTLLEAFWREFQHNENVGLLIKTYYKNFTDENKRYIKRQIRDLKTKLRLSKYPRVFLYLDLLDKDEMDRLHKTGDCFVSVHRGEGWGIPQVEATLFKNPVVSTGYSGCHEYFDDKSMKLLPYDMITVRGMDDFNHFYKKDQQWADVSIESVMRALREMYEDPKKREIIGKSGHENTKQKFNLNTVGHMMKQRIDQIQKELE